MGPAPSRPESARGRRLGQARHRARRARWRHEWREAKGFRFYLLDGERIVHVLSWHQVHNEQELGEALQQVKDTGLIPEDAVRLCVVCDGAEWIWKHVQALFPHASGARLLPLFRVLAQGGQSPTWPNSPGSGVGRSDLDPFV